MHGDDPAAKGILSGAKPSHLTGVVHRADLQKYVLPMMRAYIDTYTKDCQGVDEASASEALTQAEEASRRDAYKKSQRLADASGLHRECRSSVTLAPLRRGDSVEGKSRTTERSIEMRPTPLFQRIGKSHHCSRSAPQHQHASDAPDAGIIQSTAIVKVWMDKYPVTGGTMHVSQWAPLLLREVDDAVNCKAPKPNHVRVAAAVHIARAAFAALRIPSECLEDLLSALYVTHAGLRRRQHDTAVGVEHEDAAVPGQFTFEALADAKVQRAILNQKAIVALRRQDELALELEQVAELNRKSILREHFSAWRCLTRQCSTWGRATALHIESKKTFTYKRICFYGWKTYVALAKVESDLDHLTLHVEELHSQHAAALASQAAQFRKQIDTERRISDDAIAQMRVNQYTPEERQAHEERLCQLKRLQVEDKEIRASLSGLEERIKNLTVFKEQSSSVLRSTVDGAVRVLRSVCARRRPAGFRAADVVAAALRVETGSDMSNAPQTSSGIDVVRQPVLCSASCVLLGWVNLLLRGGQLREVAFTSMSTIGVELSDCVLYGSLWRLIQPASSLPLQLAATTEPLQKITLLLRELNDLLLAEGTTDDFRKNARGGRRGSESAANASAALLRWSPLQLASITPVAVLRGDPHAHTFLLLLFMQLYHGVFHPNILESLAPDSSMGSFLSATLTEATGSDVFTDAKTTLIRSLDSLSDFSEAISQAHTCLHYVIRSDLSWSVLLQHVYHDIVGRLSLVWREAQPTSDASAPAPALLIPSNDKRIAWFSVRGVQLSLSQMHRAVVKGTLSEDEDAPPLPASPTSQLLAEQPMPVEASTEAREIDEDTTLVLNRCAQIIPSSIRRQELFAAMEAAASLLADIFCAYSGGAPRLRSPQCVRLLHDCGVPDLEQLAGDLSPSASAACVGEGGSRAHGLSMAASFEEELSAVAQPMLSQDALIDAYATRVPNSSGKALRPLAFALMAVELALSLSRVQSDWRQSVTMSSPAMLFQTFVYQYFYCRMARPIFTDSAFRGLHHLPHHILSSSAASELKHETALLGAGDNAAAAAVDKKTISVVWDCVQTIFSAPANAAGGANVSQPPIVRVELTVDEFVKLWREVDAIEQGCTKFTVSDAKFVFNALTTSRCFVEETAGVPARTGTTKPKGAGGARPEKPPVGTASLSLGVEEFVEALALVASFKFSSPFYSYYGRLKAILSEKVCPAVKKKYPQVVAQRL